MSARKHDDALESKIRRIFDAAMRKVDEYPRAHANMSGEECVAEILMMRYLSEHIYDGLDAEVQAIVDAIYAAICEVRLSAPEAQA